GLATNVLGRILGGALAGGTGDAVTQFATTGHVNWTSVGASALMGGAFGAFARGGRGGKAPGARGEEPAPTSRAAAAAGPPRRPGGGEEPGPGARGGGREEPANAGCNGHSFSGDTRVVLADGTTKPIKDVRVGDRVAATETASGATEGKSVTALHLNH